MALVKAEYKNGENVILFTAGGKVFKNSKERAADQADQGFLSGELLLIALGNCMLGTLLNHSLLKEFPPEAVTVALESQDTTAPRRYVHISAKVQIKASALEKSRQSALGRVADKCTVGNTLKEGLQLDVELELVK